MTKRICLVSPGHVASNPRLVKEANALHQAGYDVHIVAGDYMAAIRPLDQTLLAQAPWSYTQVKPGSRWRYLQRRTYQEMARAITRLGWIPHLAIATWAHSPMSYRLAQVASLYPADLYIGHCLAALPAVAIAAHHHQSRFGFDAEDFHVGELSNTPNNQADITIRDSLERVLLPRCHHLTAASPLIADAYEKRYGIQMQPILNVFPLAEAPSNLMGDCLQSKPSTPSLYWFSQTIGTGRGLEAIVQAMGQMHTSLHLCLRGLPAAGYVDYLTQLAESLGVSDRLHWLPPAPPAEMARLAAPHDVGLSLELTDPPNRAICLTNKIFTYLLAGLPVVMSQTPAQEKLAGQLGEAAVLVNVDTPTEIAIKLDNWFASPERVRQARATAWNLGQSVYNWDVEQYRFLSIVEAALS